MKDYLFEVIPIRLFLIVTLVFYHAFAIFSGVWQPIEGYPEISIYFVLDKLSYACLLETFVFISGYIFGNQIRKKGLLYLSPKNIFIKKFRRLIIPSILFSLLYILLLGDITQPLLKTIYDLINGVGHMWFLPMLFWCFVGVYLIEKLRLRAKITIVILFCLMFLSALPLPLRLGTSFYYMLFFYIGYLIQRNNRNYGECKNILLYSAICLFIIFFYIEIICRYLYCR